MGQTAVMWIETTKQSNDRSRHKTPVVWLEVCRPNKNDDQKSEARKLVLSSSTYRRTVSEVFAEQLLQTAVDGVDQQLTLKRIAPIIKEVIVVTAGDLMAKRAAQYRSTWLPSSDQQSLVISTRTYRRTVSDVFGEQLLRVAIGALDQQLVLKRIEQVIRDLIEFTASQILEEEKAAIRATWSPVEAAERRGGLKRDYWIPPRATLKAGKKPLLGP